MSDSEQDSLQQGSANKSGSTPPQAVTPPPSLNSSFTFGSGSVPNRSILGLTPSDEVVFDVNISAGQNNGLVAKLEIKNIANKSVVFKVSKTQSKNILIKYRQSGNC